MTWVLIAIGSGVLLLAGIIGIRVWLLSRVVLANYELTFPKSIDVKSVVAVLTSLHSTLGRNHLVLELRAEDGRLRHFLRCTEDQVEPIGRALRAQLPGTRIAKVTNAFRAVEGSAVAYRLVPADAVLAVDRPEASSTAVLSSVADSRSALIQWILRPTSHPSLSLENWADAFRTRERSPDREKRLADKLWRPLFCVDIRAVSDSRLGEIRAGLNSATIPRAHLVERALPLACRHATKIGMRPVGKYGAVLNTDELAGLLGIPIGDPVVPGLTVGAAPLIVAPESIPRTGLVVAHSNFPGHEDRPLAITDEMLRRHLLVVGPTGSGKSVTLQHIILQAADRGIGLVCLDRDGDLVRDVVARWRAPLDRLVIVDANDHEYPPAFNYLHSEYLAPDQVAAGMARMIERIYGDHGVLVRRVLDNALLTLAATPGSSIVDALPLLEDPAFRDKILRRCQALERVQDFWRNFEQHHEPTTWTLPIANRLEPLSQGERTRRFFGSSKSTFSIEDAFWGKVVLINLDRARLSANAADLAATLLAARFWDVAQTQTVRPADQRRTTLLVLDEARVLADLPIGIDDMLARGRKLGVGVVTAWQGLLLAPASLRASLLANVRSRIVAGVTRDEARLLSADMHPLSADDIMALGAFEVALGVSVTGANMTVATGRTQPPAAVTPLGESLWRPHARLVGRPADEVDAEIARRQSPDSRDVPVGRRKRQ